MTEHTNWFLSEQQLQSETECPGHCVKNFLLPIKTSTYANDTHTHPEASTAVRIQLDFKLVLEVEWFRNEGRVVRVTLVPGQGPFHRVFRG